MGYKITIHHLASEDILEIARWYDVCLPGLGNRFETDLEIIILQLQSHPYNYSILFETIRKVTLKNFPAWFFMKSKKRMCMFMV